MCDLYIESYNLLAQKLVRMHDRNHDLVPRAGLWLPNSLNCESAAFGSAVQLARVI